MSRYIKAEHRKLVRKRAHSICEYCLAFEGHSFVKFQIEHIISIKHGGTSLPDNLALSRFYCNNYKGPDLGTILEDGEFCRFYNPRKDNWIDHFELNQHSIVAKTPIAVGTINIFHINHPKRLMERLALIEAGYFPHPNVKLLINNM